MIFLHFAMAYQGLENHQVAGEYKEWLEIENDSGGVA
jgi:hypothetical protein